MKPKQRNLATKLVFLVAVIALVVVAILIGLSSNQKVTAQRPEINNPAAAVTVGIIATLAPSPTASSFVLPPEKQKQKDKDATAIADAQKHPATIPTNPLTPSTNVPDLGPTAAPRTGIMEANAPYPAQYAIMRSQWSGYINNKLITVYAGAYTENPSQGFVSVQIGKPDDKDFSNKLKEFPSVIKEGKLTITAANGAVLNLVTDKGTALYFDAALLTFK